MDSGVINKDNFASILRNISQKRRQGVLEIVSGEVVTSVAFVQGKVVDVEDNRKSGAKQVVEMLKGAELLENEFQTQADSYSGLFEELGGSALGATIDGATFQRVVRNRVLSALYGIELDAGAYYSFKVQMVDFDADFNPSITIGQVLLDLVDLDSQSERFKAVFSPQQVLRSRGKGDAGGSEDERALISLLAQNLTVADLYRKSLLDRYHFEGALIALLERGAIEKGAIQHPQAKTSLASDDLFSALESSIDEVFAKESALLEAEQAEIRGRVVVAEGAAAAEAQPAVIPVVPRVSRLAIVSTRLMESRLVLAACAWAIAIAAVAVPVMFWGPLFSWFGQE